MKFLSLNKLRNNFIKNLAVSLKGNTLLLFQFIEQGKILLKLLKDVPNVHYVDGGTDLENREMVRTIAESSDNCIIVASYGTMSTGVNIRKLDNCIFCSSYKSKIKILQSLGRILRLAENKHGCKLYDIADNLCFKGSYNHTFRHFDDRIGYYEKEKFVYKKIEYQLEKD
jgi:superfamily II DNA or RNA helicase